MARRLSTKLAYTARTEADSLTWRRQFLQTFLERDLPQLGIRIPAVVLRRFWNMVAHYHGQIWNAAELARALAVNESTVRRYLDLMTGVFMVRKLPPWFENLGKRQVKAPKIGSTQQSVRVLILRSFLKSDEFGLGGGQALRLQQQIVHVSVPAAATEESFDVAVDGFYNPHRHLGFAVVQDSFHMLE